MNKVKNTGVILGKFDKRTYIAGTIPFEIRNPSGDWEGFQPPGEWQKNAEDTMACVTFSALNSIETQEKFLTGNQVNYSDRWIAKLSNTTRQGNYLDKVAQTIREYGLVLEESYPSNSNMSWDEYYQEISEPLFSQLKTEGKAWKEKFDVRFEEISHTKSSLQQQLKQSPPQYVLPGHAVENLSSNIKTDRIFDSYEPFLNDVPSVYYPSKPVYAMKIILYKKEQALDPDFLFTDLKFGDSGTKVLKLKRALKRLGWTNKDGDVYDENLAEVVMNWKLANTLSYSYWARRWEQFGPASWGFKGREFNAKDREYINQNLTKVK